MFLLSGTNLWAQAYRVLDTGDPAERVCNPKSYTDLGNGIVRDNVTGLDWQQATAPGTYAWQGALDYCSSLALGGYSDWRLPSIEELSTLVDAGRIEPAIDTAYFPDTAASGYWSSTVSLYGAGYAWDVHFSPGWVDYAETSDESYVRAVRGEPLQTAHSFIDNGDGTVTDTSTGLEWQQGHCAGHLYLAGGA